MHAGGFAAPLGQLEQGDGNVASTTVTHVHTARLSYARACQHANRLADGGLLELMSRAIAQPRAAFAHAYAPSGREVIGPPSVRAPAAVTAEIHARHPRGTPSNPYDTEDTAIAGENISLGPRAWPRCWQGRGSGCPIPSLITNMG